jgi:capsular exopolysaccharide synthesis family protein
MSSLPDLTQSRKVAGSLPEDLSWRGDRSRPGRPGSGGATLQDLAAATNGATGKRSAAARGAAQPIDDHLVSLLVPRGFEAEQFRALRLLVEQRFQLGGPVVLAVTSAVPGEGKTTIALNLAGALAQSSDARVLVVDADLRMPAVAKYLGLGGSEGPGLAGGVQNTAYSLDSIIRQRPPLTLSILPAGKRPDSPYEVLRSPRLGEIIEAARRFHDYVIVDAPPLLGLADCHLLARWVDGFLVVVAADRTPRGLVEEALDALEPGKLVGLVLNGDLDRLASRYEGYYGTSARR